MFDNISYNVLFGLIIIVIILFGYYLWTYDSNYKYKYRQIKEAMINKQVQAVITDLENNRREAIIENYEIRKQLEKLKDIEKRHNKMERDYDKLKEELETLYKKKLHYV